MALLLALVVLAVAGTFLVAGFYGAQRNDRSDRLTLRVAQLDATNDLAAAVLLTNWDSAARFRQPAGSTARVPAPVNAPNTISSGWFTRISGTIYLATLRSQDLADTSVFARSSWLLRVDGPRWPTVAPLIAGGDVRAEGMLQILPPAPLAAPACEPAPQSWAPIAVPPGRSAPGTHVEWVPAGEDSTYRAFGGVALQSLAARATVPLIPAGPVQVPIGAVILAPGDLDLVGGSGRGLLIVEGQLRISGPIVFRGVILALGGVHVNAKGAVVEGLLLAAGPSDSAVVVDSNADFRLRYDPCLAADVAWHAGKVGPFPLRGWTPAP